MVFGTWVLGVRGVRLVLRVRVLVRVVCLLCVGVPDLYDPGLSGFSPLRKDDLLNDYTHRRVLIKKSVAKNARKGSF